MPANHRLDNEAIVGADAQSAVIAWGGGLGTYAAWGSDFDTGTYTLQVSYDNGTTWIAVGSDTTLTAAGHGNFDLPPGVLVRVDANGNGSIDITVTIRPRRPIA